MVCGGGRGGGEGPNERWHDSGYVKDAFCFHPDVFPRLIEGFSEKTPPGRQNPQLWGISGRWASPQLTNQEIFVVR